MATLLSEGQEAEEKGEEESDDEGPRTFDWSALGAELSPETLAALQLHVKEETEDAAADLTNQAEEPAPGSTLPTEAFGMSQFWWDDESSEALGQEALDMVAAMTPPPGASSNSGSSGTGSRGTRPRIAILSAPSVWAALQRIFARMDAGGGGE